MVRGCQNRQLTEGYQAQAGLSHVSFLLFSSPILPGSVSRYTWPAQNSASRNLARLGPPPRPPRSGGGGCGRSSALERNAPAKGPTARRAPAAPGPPPPPGATRAEAVPAAPLPDPSCRHPRPRLQGPGFGAAPAEPRACGRPALGSPRPPLRARRTYRRTRPRSRRSRAR